MRRTTTATAAAGVLVAAAATIFMAPPGVKADTYTYPVKSINLTDANTVQFYSMIDVSVSTVYDAHPVHGVQTSDGGYVLCGKGLETDGGSVTEAFAVKFSSTGAFQWVWKSSAAGNDVANAVAVVSSTEVVVVGYRTVSGVAKRSITKLSTANGAEAWTGTDFGDASATSNGVYEMVHVEGDVAYLSGVYQKPNTQEMSFKSYGNVVDGTAIVQKITLANLAGSAAPTSASIAWSVPFSGYNSAKAARPVGSNVAVLVYGEPAGKHASAVMLQASDGATVWGPTDYETDHGEATDLQIAPDAASFVLSGQGKPTTGTLYGRLTSIAVSDGTRRWTQTYTAGGTPTLIFNECWGTLALSDGYVMACGTGIENCPNTLSATDLTNCNDGRGDQRANAYLRAASVWQSMIIRTDTAGNLLWQRVDSYKAPNGPAMPAPPGPTGGTGWTSSAAEWVMVTSDGGLLSVNDEVNGIGLLKLSAPSTGSGSTTPSSSSNINDNSSATSKMGPTLVALAVVAGALAATLVQ